MRYKTGYQSTAIDDNSNKYPEISKFYDNKNGLPQVYKVTQSVNQITSTAWFRGESNNIDDGYMAANAPFFNYSGSVYLSFLLKGDPGFHHDTGSSG